MYRSLQFLSCPANFPEDVVESLPSELKSGVYLGWASVDQGPIYKMVMSIGWNPQFQNEKRSMVNDDNTIYHNLLELQDSCMSHGSPLIPLGNHSSQSESFFSYFVLACIKNMVDI